MKINIQDTEDGIYIFRVPDKPLMALRGKYKHLKISSEDIRKLRQEDEKKDKIELL